MNFAVVLFYAEKEKRKPEFLMSKRLDENCKYTLWCEDGKWICNEDYSEDDDRK